LTLAEIPSSRLSRFSMRAAQDVQVIPDTDSSTERSESGRTGTAGDSVDTR
jgi:hypothetical protein